MIKNFYKSVKLLKWKRLIKNSGLFDEKYYLFTYPDVREADMEPIFHYIKVGSDEGRNPSNEFDTRFYLQNNTDVNPKKINPLVHYILFGKKEKRFENSSQIKNVEMPNSNDSSSYGFLNGKRKYNKNQESIIFVSHESSATGAPLLGYSIADKLIKKYNITHLVIRKANILIG